MASREGQELDGFCAVALMRDNGGGNFLGDSFTHLHVHTEYSMLDGAAKLTELVAKAAADGQKALGITDHGNMYGVIEFYKECREQGVKPILGIEAYMAHEHRSERIARRGRHDDNGGTGDQGKKQYYHLTLLAENNNGYQNLIRLSSLAFLEGFHYKPRIDWELLEKYSDGLIASTGCLGGHVLQSLLNGDERGALEKASRLQDIFGKDNLFVELQDHGLPEQIQTNPQLIKIANAIGAPLLATNDSHYVHQHDHASHDALLCIQTGALQSDANRFRFTGTEHYLKTAEEMRYIWRETPTACDNTLWIAERSNVEIEFGVTKLPIFPVPDPNTNEAEYLDKLTWEGAKKRWGADLSPEVVERLSYELATIKAMNFASYFLIVWDLINYAHTRGIRVGPGRGSAAGCAVAYCLRITDLDPLKYDLLFERFLNPSRQSMPDIDMDFDSRYREEMIQYAAHKYGRDHVAQIITFATIKSRNAVRDAARILGYEYGVGDKIAKAMPPLMQGRDTSLMHCLEKTPKFEEGYAAAADLRAMYDNDEVVHKVIEVAKGIEGLKRSDGIHAAAVVITRDPLIESLPVQRKPIDGDINAGPVVTQYEMNAVGELGLLKMDFLGLRNLDVITDTVEMVREQSDPDFDIDNVSLNDPATFNLLGRGDTVGVFQLESPPMRALLRSLKPTSFGDVSAVIALYRPGPMKANMHNDYADYKNGRKPVEYFHPDAKALLNDTFGLMVYQESMMRVAQKFAGYTLAQADNLRAACSKKVREKMLEERVRFVEGCESTGYGKVLGELLFKIIEGFADYAFNKSHAYGYGLLSYQTAFLKANYPVQYMAALLSSVKGNYEKAAIYLADARASNVSVLTPDINRSRSNFVAGSADQGRTVAFALSAIRNVGEGLVEMIVAERELGGEFISFYDFVQRVPEQALNKRAVESLIKAGAFDLLKHERRGLLLVSDQVVDEVLVKRREHDKGVYSLFDSVTDGSIDWSSLTPIPDLKFVKADQLRHEKEMLGLYISDHPLLGLQSILQQRVDCSIAFLAERENGPVAIGGVITGMTRRFTKKGDQMATLVLEDMESSVEIVVYSKVLTEYGHLLNDDAVVCISGMLQNDDRQKRFVANRVAMIDGLGNGPTELHLQLSAQLLSEVRVDILKGILANHPGTCSVILHLGDDIQLSLGGHFMVDVDKVIGPLRIEFGSSVVSF